MVLLISGGLSSASIINNKKNLDGNYSEPVKTSDLGETILFPPWGGHNHWENIWSEGLGWAQANSESTEYSGWAWTNIGVPDIGKARADAHFYHDPFATLDDCYRACKSDYYDFTLYYSYDGTIDIEVGNFGGAAYLDDLVKIMPVIAIFDKDQNWLNSFSKTIMIEEGSWGGNHYKTFDEDIEISFTNVYVPADGYVWIEVQGYVWEFAAVVGWAFATGEIELNGKLTKVKILDPNDPPNAPSINGETSGKTGTSYTYKFTATDPNNDQISYYIKWGDGSTSGWTPYQFSGATYSASHSWSVDGIYSINAKTKDICGTESDYWGTLKVTLFSLFESFPNLFPALRHLLGL